MFTKTEPQFAIVADEVHVIQTISRVYPALKNQRLISTFDNWRLHERKTKVQGNQRFIFLAASWLSHVEENSKNLGDQGN